MHFPFLSRRSCLRSLAGIMSTPIIARWIGTRIPQELHVGSSSLHPIGEESLISYVQRVQGRWDEGFYQQWLGHANAFKEGDQLVGVAAPDEETRNAARQLLSRTTPREIDEHAPHRDQLFLSIQSEVQVERMGLRYDQPLADLVAFLLQAPEEAIHPILPGLSSDVIACLVRLMSNAELTQLSSNLFHPLPGTQIGARGYLGARIQPNSPTDHPDDIRWQVFNAFAFAIGDVLIGTNPVSSNPQSVLLVEQTLQEIVQTFELESVVPHCVLAHIDVQAEVERMQPGSTALWFQSIAGNDTANATFDISVEKMESYAKQRKGPYGLYFETGQGADFTNGHAHGCDMVLWESRKYGWARHLAKMVAQHGTKSQQAWVHVNDVAGFIGPEVFRSREQLVRCCLEDLVMAKMHGLTIGLDVCSTLHMDVSMEDLDWCLEQIAPAQPAYLMALPTKIDPMLGYLTTGYHDHVRLRERFSAKVNDRMWAFFRELGVVDAAGNPTEHFGDPQWVYQAYCRRKGDSRSVEALEQEGREARQAVRRRGVFLAEGFGATPSTMPNRLQQELTHIYNDAKTCIWKEWDNNFIATIPAPVRLMTQSLHREDYILHPERGEKLSPESLARLIELRADQTERHALQMVISEGLNAAACMDSGNLLPLLDAIRTRVNEMGLSIAPEHLVVTHGRVRAGYRIGETLFAGRTDRCGIIHVIGERPGTGHHTLSLYITFTDGELWNQSGGVDHHVTRVVSGIATTALRPHLAAEELTRILRLSS